MTRQPPLPRLPHASSTSLDIIRIELDHRLYEDGLTLNRFKKPGNGVLEITVEQTPLPAGEARKVARVSTEQYLSDDGLEYSVEEEPEGVRFDVADQVMHHHRFTIRIYPGG